MVDTLITSVVNTPSEQIVTKASLAATTGAWTIWTADSWWYFSSATVEWNLQESWSKILALETNTITVVTGTYTILSTDETVICNKTTAFTATLPPWVVWKKLYVSNINTWVVTLEGDWSDTIDGELNQSIYQDDTIELQCYIANKRKIL